MYSNNNPEQFPDGIIMLRILHKWRKQILWFVILSGLAAMIFSSPYFIPPYYRSEVIFYPPGTNSNKILIEKDPRFGSDKEIDEQIQIIKSGSVRDSIINKYRLVAHYKIDTTENSWLYSLFKKLESNITIERTQYNSISVNVFDTDPVMAAQMANDIVTIGDAVKSAIIKKNLQQAFNSISKEYFDKSLETDKIVETLNEFIENPISMHVTEKDKSYTEKLKVQLDIQDAMEKARKAGRLKDLEALYNYQLKLQQLNEIQSSYFQAYLGLNSAIPSCYMITPAEVTYKKAGPKRLLITTVAIVAALVFGSVLAITIEKFKSFKILLADN